MVFHHNESIRARSPDCERATWCIASSHCSTSVRGPPILRSDSPVFFVLFLDLLSRVIPGEGGLFEEEEVVLKLEEGSGIPI